jgi:sec-independent protein translocase protein TatA
MHFGMGEMLIVLVVALLVFGPAKLPQLGDALGKGIRNFKKASSGHDEPEVPQAPAQLPGAASTQARSGQPSSTTRV